MSLKSVSKQAFILLISSILIFSVGCSDSNSDDVTASDSSAIIPGSVATNSGVVTTIAGSGSAGSANGTGTDASFYGPTGVAIDSAGNIIVADSNNHLIRKIQ